MSFGVRHEVIRSRSVELVLDEFSHADPLAVSWEFLPGAPLWPGYPDFPYVEPSMPHLILGEALRRFGSCTAREDD